MGCRRHGKVDTAAPGEAVQAPQTVTRLFTGDPPKSISTANSDKIRHRRSGKVDTADPGEGVQVLQTATTLVTGDPAKSTGASGRDSESTAIHTGASIEYIVFLGFLYVVAHELALYARVQSRLPKHRNTRGRRHGIRRFAQIILRRCSGTRAICVDSSGQDSENTAIRAGEGMECIVLLRFACADAP